MTSEKILKKAVEKAVASGYDFNLGDFTDPYKQVALSLHNYHIIFSHDFAKAFWQYTTERIDVPSSTFETYKSTHPIARKGYTMTRKRGRSWKWHLQQMVLEADPIRYLEQFLS